LLGPRRLFSGYLTVLFLLDLIPVIIIDQQGERIFLGKGYLTAVNYLASRGISFCYPRNGKVDEYSNFIILLRLLGWGYWKFRPDRCISEGHTIL